MNKSIYLAGIMAAFLLAGTAIGVAAPVFAEESDAKNKGEDDSASEGSSQGLTGEQEEGGENGAGVGGLSGLILYAVIAAVVGTIAYTGYKIFASRKRAVRTNP